MSTGTLNGHALPSGTTEEVKVDIESPETPAEEKTVITPEADGTEGDTFLDCVRAFVSVKVCPCFCVCVHTHVCYPTVLSHLQ